MHLPLKFTLGVSQTDSNTAHTNTRVISQCLPKALDNPWAVVIWVLLFISLVKGLFLRLGL